MADGFPRGFLPDHPRWLRKLVLSHALGTRRGRPLPRIPRNLQPPSPPAAPPPAAPPSPSTPSPPTTPGAPE